MKNILISLMGIVFAGSLFSCAGQVVKTDLQSVEENPDAYKGKRVVITTDLKSLAEKPEDYLEKKVELKGFAEYREGPLRPYWHFVLKDEEGRSLKCYERNYHNYVWEWPLMTVRKAKRNKEQLTVVGRFEKRGVLELDWIEYDGETINTDYVPLHRRHFRHHRGYYGYY